MVALRDKICFALLLLVLLVASLQASVRYIGANQMLPSAKNVAGGETVQRYALAYEVTGNPNNGIEALKRIYGYIGVYRGKQAGRYPSHIMDLFDAMEQSPQDYGFKNSQEARSVLINPDNRHSDDPSIRNQASDTISYVIIDKRHDGSSVGGPKLVNTRDVLAYTNIYFHENIRVSEDKSRSTNPAGFYLVLWDDGQVEKISYDRVLYAFNGKAHSVAFPGQAGLPFNCVTYIDFWAKAFTQKSYVGKPVARGQAETIPDNGGPESLVSLSRLLSAPIERERMWKVFDPTQAEFSLEDVQSGAAKLGLNLQLRNLTLDELAKQGNPAILYLSDVSRLVTLASLDTQQATVLDQGITRIVSRDVLARRYSGQALVPARATQAQSGIDVDDAVRELELTDASQEVTQQVSISNTGRQALTLQLEHPTCGCTKAELSNNTVAPGQKATLNLTLRWRSVLKGDTQNVFVFVRTNDPLRPRLQLGFQLRLAKA